MGSDPTSARARVLRALARAVPLLLAAAAPLLLAGCAPGDWRRDPTDNSTRILGQRAWVTVTTDGGRTMVARRSIRLERGDTALSLLEQVADVRTAPDGAIAQVNGMGGGALGTFGPKAQGWYYRVDGIESTGLRPDRFRVKPGQSIWWDLRRFDIYERLPVAVGNFPEPLFSGWRDSRRPLRISYGTGLEEDARFLRQSVFRVLEPDVVSIKGDTGIAGIGGEDSRGDRDLDTTVAVRRGRANLVVARWEQVRLDPFVIDIGTNPRDFGLTVWIEGTDVMRQDPDMEFSQRLAGAEGVVWATTTDGVPDGTIVFLVTGVTDEGVRAAVRALRSGACQYYLACAVDRDGDVVR